MQGFVFPHLGRLSWGEPLRRQRLHRGARESNSMLKVSFSLVVGNLVYFFTFPAFLTNLTPPAVCIALSSRGGVAAAGGRLSPALPRQPHQLDLEKY